MSAKERAIWCPTQTRTHPKCFYNALGKVAFKNILGMACCFPNVTLFLQGLIDEVFLQGLIDG